MDVFDQLERLLRERIVIIDGALGPMTRAASISSPNLNDASARNLTYVQAADAYYDQLCGLMEGGVDILITETAFDPLNQKAALFAIQRYLDETGRRVPV